MDPTLDLDSLRLFIAFVMPGLISMSVYRMLMPSHAMDWGTTLLQGLFYSSVNFALLMPLVIFLSGRSSPTASPIAYWLAALTTLIIAPTIWPVLLRAVFRWPLLASRLRTPYPSVWDQVFDGRDPAFVLVHLKDGTLLGGFWGRSSYAGSFPYHGDIYLEAVYTVVEDGEFGDPLPGTRGVLLRRDDYSYLEMFDPPRKE